MGVKMTVKTNKVAFEEALDMTGYGRYNILMFMLCSSIIVGMTFEIFSVSYLVPANACELQTSTAQQGLMASVPIAGVLATSHLWGYLADTRGRRKTVIISMTMCFVSGSIAAFSFNWIIFAITKFIASASVSGAYALSVTLLSETTPMNKRSMLVMFSTSIFLLSTGVMAILVIPILPLGFSYYVPFLGIQFNSWRVLDLVFTVPSAFCAIGAYYSYESPKFLLTIGREEEALEVLKGIYVMNTGKGADSFKVDTLFLDEDSASSVPKGFWRSMAAQTLPMLKPPLLKYTILLAVLFFMTYISNNSFMIWLPFIINAIISNVMAGNTDLSLCEMVRTSAGNNTSMVEPHQCSFNSQALTLVFAISTILAVFNIVISSVVNRVGRKRLFIIIQVVAGISAICVNLSPYWVLNAILFMVFLSGSLNYGFLNTFSVDIFPTYVKAMAVCLTLMVGRGSAVIGINIVKRLLDTDCEASFYIFGGVTLVCGAVALLLPSDAKILEQKKARPE